MLADKKGKLLMTYVPDYTVFDLETTGVSCKTDEVVEISAIKVRGGEAVEEYSTLVNPGMHIPEGASEVNGITDDMVKDSPSFEEAFKDFLDFAGDDILVGHNISRFDLNFLYRDAEKFWGKTLGNDFADTLMLSWRYLPKLEHYTLSDMAEHYGIDSEGAHRALADCRMNREVYEGLRKDIENPSADAKAVKVCPRCGNMLKKRNGKFGEFYGCMGYPDCRYTENI